MPGLSRPIAVTAKWRTGRSMSRPAGTSIPMTEPMLSQSEISDERRQGRMVAVATIAAGLLVGIGTFWSLIVNRDRPDGDAESLRFYHDHSTALITASVLRAVGFLFLIATILYLHRATKARNPDLQSIPLMVGLFGAVAFALGTTGQAFALESEAQDFVAKTFQSAHAADEAAKDVSGETIPLATSILAFAGTIALAFWFVLASLNAMRVGLLTRFMGVLGIIVGASFIFGLAPPVMAFWLLALGALFLGRWPGGMPPAWDAGEARPWPPRVQPGDSEEDQVEEVGGSRNGEVDAVGPGVRPADSTGQNQQPAGSGRRKRKRRQTK
jgi:Domain of unknown function (DUF4386)